MAKNKSKLICLLFFIIIFFIRANNLLGTKTKNSYKEDVVTTHGYKFTLEVFDYLYIEEAKKVRDIVKIAFDQAAEALNSDCLPEIMENGKKKCIKTELRQKLREKINIEYHVLQNLLAEGYGLGECPGNKIKIYNPASFTVHYTNYNGNTTTAELKGLILHELLHLPGYCNEDISESCKSKLKIKNSKLKIRKK